MNNVFANRLPEYLSGAEIHSSLQMCSMDWPAVRGVQAEIEEGEANVVRQIFQMYANGMGLAQIAIRLNREGVASPAAAKNQLRQDWSRYTIREMLHNERYRGVLVWERTKRG